MSKILNKKNKILVDLLNKEVGSIDLIESDDAVVIVIKTKKVSREEEKKTNKIGNGKKKEMKKVENYLEELKKKGYTIVEDKRKIKEISEKIKKKRVEKHVYGIIGFDGQLYLCERSFFNRMENTVKKIFNKQKEIDLTKMLKKNKEKYRAYKVVLMIMLEKGDLIEKRRDVFCQA